MPAEIDITKVRLQFNNGKRSTFPAYTCPITDVLFLMIDHGINNKKMQ